MSLQPIIPALVAILLVSVGGIVAGINLDAGAAAHAAAAAFTAAIAAVTVIINRPHWHRAGAAPDPIEAVHMTRRNTRLAALVYGWGGLTLLSVDWLTSLDWYHYGQYGIGAALIAAGLFWYVRRLGEPEHAKAPPLALTAAHALAAATGLAFLVGTGKVLSQRADWAANVVFLWGGIAIVALCLAAARTQSRLTRS